MITDFQKKSLYDRLALIFETHASAAMAELETNDFYFKFDLRPSYCDRGNYMWFVDHKDARVHNIDGADMFPRIYFRLDSLVNEMIAWMEKRKQVFV